jgi:hypothetical protein
LSWACHSTGRRLKATSTIPGIGFCPCADAISARRFRLLLFLQFAVCFVLPCYTHP